jgi:hypothetical protein
VTNGKVSGWSQDEKCHDFERYGGDIREQNMQTISKQNNQGNRGSNKF